MVHHIHVKRILYDAFYIVSIMVYNLVYCMVYYLIYCMVYSVATPQGCTVPSPPHVLLLKAELCQPSLVNAGVQDSTQTTLQGFNTGWLGSFLYLENAFLFKQARAKLY